uniref:Uncharacterized protein n=1 Tax=Magallana gigas TaxID=29159 RepID=A0A8W8MKS9_MAGGI
MNTLRKLRREMDIIVSEVSMIRDIRDREIRIYTDAGRICRPLLIVENQKLLLKQSHIKQLKQREYNNYRPIILLKYNEMKAKVAVNVISLFINVTSAVNVNYLLLVILSTVKCVRNVIMSQSSVFSSASTIPPSIIDQDDDFNDELSHVNDLFFGNVEFDVGAECSAVTSVSDESDSDSEDVCNDLNNNDDNDFEISDYDKREAQCVYDFYGNTCGCSRLYGKPCSSVIDRNVLNDYRNICLETDKSELDMLIKVQLFHHRNNSSETSAKKHKTKERERVRQVYHFSGIQVCRETFAFAHGISRKTIDSIARSLDHDGFGARIHGNKGKSPKHALTMEDVKRVKQFLISYANKYGLPLPGRLPNFRNEKTILLPSDKTKAEVHQEYLTLADEMSLRKICLSQFKTVWLEQCPHILIMKPATDLCHTCQSFSSTLSCSGNLNEEEKEDILSKYQEHVGHVKEQRDHYRDQCAEAKSTFAQLAPEQKIRGQPPCTLQSEFHYSFDYAQQVHYPHYAQQVGPLFFKTPRKCQCFGICCEGSDVKLHMDNCSGQNKNNTVIGYGMWRVMIGLHESVEFSMMESGHTKFNPDWHFGLWKVKWRHSNVETLAEIAASVWKSSRNGHNVPQLVDDPVAPLFFYDWATFFKRICKPIPSLKSYHHFRMDKGHPGIVFVREYATSQEVSVNILKAGAAVDPTVLPLVILPSGLDAHRQWYLFNEVAPYCVNKESCPKPTVPKPLIKIDLPSLARKCSKCKLTGHNKTTCRI